jgi:hypothetical protein
MERRDVCQDHALLVSSARYFAYACPLESAATQSYNLQGTELSGRLASTGHIES